MSAEIVALPGGRLPDWPFGYLELVRVAGFPGAPMRFLGVVNASDRRIAKLGRRGDRGLTYADLSRVTLWDEP
jgi:hypothetical protein